MSEDFFRDRFKRDFATIPERLDGEKDERARLSSRLIPYGVSFLDNMINGILPRDLILLGARTGAGKTALASIVAERAALRGKRVHYFALEAEDKEIERRLKYRNLAAYVWAKFKEGKLSAGQARVMNYRNWYLGDCDHLFKGEPEEMAESVIRDKFKTLKTLYRGKDFSDDDVERLFRSVQEESDLIILDHLHYVDIDDRSGENAAYKRLVKRIRDVVLSIEVPVLAIAHLRKRDGRRTLLPELDDFHGSSDITKIATGAIMLAPAVDQQSTDARFAKTYMHVPKDRMGGTSGYVALLDYNLGTCRYEEEYRLGRLNVAGDRWDEITGDDLPVWAVGAGSMKGRGQ